jgi:hypothetical protein
MRRSLAALLFVVAAVAIAGCGSSAPAPRSVARPTRAGVAKSQTTQPTVLVALHSGTFGSAGSPTVGEVLTTTNGTWTNNPTSYTYQWQHCSSGPGCSNISGATASSYTIVSGDAGDTIVVIVTAYNAGGQASQTSAPTGTVPGGGGGLVPCALTYTAGVGATSCWATHTGVQGSTGYTEAQIVAGQAGFTHYTGTLVATANTTYDHYWINGCIVVNQAAPNVTIQNSLITDPSGGGNCKGGEHAAEHHQQRQLNDQSPRSGRERHND